MTPTQFREIEDLLSHSEHLSAADRQLWIRQRATSPEVAAASLSLLADDPPEDFLQRALPETQNFAFSSSSAPGDKIGPWRLGSKIGRGGMGSVFLASREDGVFQQTAAIKVLDGLQRNSVDRRFRRESSVLARLNHPNIVRLLDAGLTPDGIAWMALEFVNGIPCTDWAAAQGRRQSDLLALFLQICAAVQSAHSQLVVHRDLKPSNVLVDASGTPHVLDFGEAHQLGNPAGYTATIAPGLTLNYASPAQILGQPATTADDIYSLGVLLHHMLTGTLPHMRDSMTLPELIRQAESAGPPPPGTTLSRDLASILNKAIAHDAGLRYPSVDALVADIGRYQRGYPVNARPPGLTLRALKFLRRNRVGLAVAALALVLLTSGVAMVWRSALEADRQREIAVAFARQTDLQRREADRQRSIAEHQRSIAEQTAARESIALQAASRSAAAAQASLKEARTRFRDVRNLAATLLFKLEPEARKVPGNTAFRKQLIAEAASYYENLSRSLKGEAGEDEVWKEIANAWQRLGSIQGDQNATWNLGDSSGALLSFRRALAAQEMRLRSRPANTEILCDVEDARITLAAHMRSMALTGEANKLLQQSVQTMTGPQANPRNDRVLQVLARAYFYTDLRAYRKICEDLFSRHPDDLKILRNTALAYKYTLPTDSLDDRLSYARRALQIDQRRAEQIPDDQTINLDISFDWSTIGTTLTYLGRRQEAVDAYRSSLEIRRRLAQADPSNIRFQERFAAGIFYLATSLIPSGNKDEIVTLAEQGQAILTSIRGKLTEQTETILTVHSEALLARFAGKSQSLRCQHAAKALQLAPRLPASDFLLNQHLPALRKISTGCSP